VIVDLDAAWLARIEAVHTVCPALGVFSGLNATQV
jgi:hypothetical protein